MKHVIHEMMPAMIAQAKVSLLSSVKALVWSLRIHSLKRSLLVGLFIYLFIYLLLLLLLLLLL